MILAALLAAAVPDPRAADAVKLFASLCASARGSRGVAMARLGDGNGMGRRMTAAEVSALQDGAAGGMGWALTAPSRAALVLDFAAGGTCAVRVDDAEPAALRTAFDAAVTMLAEGFGSVRSAAVEQAVAVGGNRIRTVGYTYRAGGRTVSVSLSTGDRPIAAHRHLMSFAWLD